MEDGFSDDIDALFDATPPGVSMRVARALSAFAAQARELAGAGLQSVTGRPVQVSDVSMKVATYAEVEAEFAAVAHVGFDIRVASSSAEAHPFSALVTLPDLGALFALEMDEASLVDPDFLGGQASTAGANVRELLDFVSVTLFTGMWSGIEASLVDHRVDQVDQTMRALAESTQNAPAVRIDLSLSGEAGAAGTITLIVPEPLLEHLADAATPEDDVEPLEPTPLRRGPALDVRSAAPSAPADHDDVEVHPVRFPPLPEVRGLPPVVTPRSLDLIMDVSMRVTVELGRSTMTVEEVLSLGPGSVVELNKLAGEPVDVLVNEQLIARGEVVVVDENFGVRVTEIVSPRRRAHAIGGA
ncbi:MAG: flagellar motor switch protein FliN [Dehalococcoidia bacterium]|nr:MAG: flagellar motor switch protein FliN [Dehalococcoidia bacterium]